MGAAAGCSVGAGVLVCVVSVVVVVCVVADVAVVVGTEHGPVQTRFTLVGSGQLAEEPPGN